MLRPLFIVAFLQYFLVVRYDVAEADFTGNSYGGLIILYSLDERPATNPRVPRLAFFQIVRGLFRVHLGDLPLEELLVLAETLLDLLFLLPRSRLLEDFLRLNFFKLVQ